MRLFDGLKESDGLMSVDVAVLCIDRRDERKKVLADDESTTPTLSFASTRHANSIANAKRSVER